MSKRIAIAAVLIAIATPALAEEFYVGQDPEIEEVQNSHGEARRSNHDHDRHGVLCHQGRRESRQEGRGRVPEEGKRQLVLVLNRRAPPARAPKPVVLLQLVVS